MEEERKITNAPPSGPILKNEFRDEVRDPYAGIPEDELVTRDQAVLLRELNFHIDIKEADRVHIEGAIEKGIALRMELLALPKSPYREDCLCDIDIFIEANKKKVETFKTPRSTFITLLALEELFAETEEVEGETFEERLNDINESKETPVSDSTDTNTGEDAPAEFSEDEDDIGARRLL